MIIFTSKFFIHFLTNNLLTMTNTLKLPLLLKRFLILFSLIFTIGMINSTSADAARKNINMTVKSTDGTVWHIKG